MSTSLPCRFCCFPVSHPGPASGRSEPRTAVRQSNHLFFSRFRPQVWIKIPVLAQSLRPKWVASKVQTVFLLALWAASVLLRAALGPGRGASAAARLMCAQRRSRGAADADPAETRAARWNARDGRARARCEHVAFFSNASKQARMLQKQVARGRRLLGAYLSYLLTRSTGSMALVVMRLDHCVNVGRLWVLVCFFDFGVTARLPLIWVLSCDTIWLS